MADAASIRIFALVPDPASVRICWKCLRRADISSQNAGQALSIAGDLQVRGDADRRSERDIAIVAVRFEIVVVLVIIVVVIIHVRMQGIVR